MIPRRKTLAAGALLAAYLLLEWLEYGYGYSPLGVTPWDPSIGVAFGALLLGGLEFLPVVLIGEMGSAVITDGFPPPLGPSVADAVVVAANWGVAALVLRRHIDIRLSSQYDLVVLILVAAVAALTDAMAQIAIIWIDAGIPPQTVIGPILARAWIGSMIGVMVMTPVMLVHRQPPGRQTRRDLIEIGLQSLVTAGVLWLIFAELPADGLQLFYLLFLPGTWVAARFGLRGAVLINLVMQIGVAIAFVLAVVDTDAVTGNQFRMLALSLSTLFLGAAVSQRRRVEGDLRDRQDQQARYSRLSTAGEMAAALAHELNQPLAATITYTRAAQRLLALPLVDEAKVRTAMDGAAAQAERAGKIIRTLREFIGRGVLNREPHSMAALIYDSVALVRPECQRAGIHMEVSLDRAMPTVEVDAVQIQQVLVNLIRNAAEVLAKSGGRRRRIITVSARRNDRAEIEVEVADSGSGMPDDMAEQLFRPFSTTKAEGMGLGLSISRTIIDAHGGKLWLAASGPDGCSFRFTLAATTQHHQNG